MKDGFLRHVVAGVAVAVIGVVGMMVGAALTFVGATWMCEADYSEATIVAPRSFRGRLVCGIDGEGQLSDRAPWIIIGVVALCAVAALVVWARTIRWSRLVPLLALQALAPALVAVGIGLVPADCTDGQWEKYGAPGCERSEEERPGIGVLGVPATTLAMSRRHP
jgi:hypothetical protein